MHGFESVVGPVKGVFDKEMSLNKAREHTLLRSDRPPYVTILSLGQTFLFLSRHFEWLQRDPMILTSPFFLFVVRDAAARLPNGEGTRAEICELLKDSQFLAPDVTSAQVFTFTYSHTFSRVTYFSDQTLHRPVAEPGFVADAAS